MDRMYCEQACCHKRQLAVVKHAPGNEKQQKHHEQVQYEVYQVKGQWPGSEKLVTEQIPERHHRTVVVMGVVSAKERPNRGGENLL
jgi:hypothetical protein